MNIIINYTYKIIDLKLDGKYQQKEWESSWLLNPFLQLSLIYTKIQSIDPILLHNRINNGIVWDFAGLRGGVLVYQMEVK